ncbi:Protein SRG1 [Hibiscus syriacus]|uniref:Protein SRG1 n=1 Tax=Hibiscus syriacus TaxID=106335 RepID=A0A6A3BT90_HIBSY|nr:Protein SRG1 [Hibiscus syriacus]
MESPKEPVIFGRSLIVPSVQELAKEPLSKIPHRYHRPHQESPSIPSDYHLPSVPIIDFQKLAADDFIGSELERLHSACKDWGFFQVVNHGVSLKLLDEFKLEIENFFKLPHEDKKLLWQTPDDHEGFGQLFVVSEDQKLDWSDMFYIPRYHSIFVREIMEVYCTEVKNLAMRTLDYMAKALKMDGEEMRAMFDDGVQAMRMNYYPPCPQPDMTIGFSPHSDADALTILFQLDETEGLQVRKDGKWIPIKPLPNAFVVNIGDIMEILSNGIYRSIEHRAVVNSTKQRLSIATFYSSKLDRELGPAHSLIVPNNPAIFRRVPLEKYFKEFFAQKLNGKGYLDFMRIKNNDEHEN